MNNRFAMCLLCLCSSFLLDSSFAEKEIPGNRYYLDSEPAKMTPDDRTTVVRKGRRQGSQRK